jgi:hypothetical protein
MPLAAGFRLRGIEARWGAVLCPREMGEGTRKRAQWSLTLGREGMSGLPHHQKPARSGFGEGRLIYPPCPMGAPHGKLGAALPSC